MRACLLITALCISFHCYGCLWYDISVHKTHKSPIHDTINCVSIYILISGSKGTAVKHPLDPKTLIFLINAFVFIYCLTFCLYLLFEPVACTSPNGFSMDILAICFSLFCYLFFFYNDVKE